MSDLETEARQLRDEIYGPSTQNNWEHCRDAWMRDIKWLRETAAKDRNKKIKS